MYEINDHKERTMRGVESVRECSEYFDEHFPGWWMQIIPHELQMDDVTACMTGQTFRAGLEGALELGRFAYIKGIYEGDHDQEVSEFDRFYEEVQAAMQAKGIDTYAIDGPSFVVPLWELEILLRRRSQYIGRPIDGRRAQQSVNRTLVLA